MEGYCAECRGRGLGRAWRGSDRAARLPRDWAARRLRVLRRDGWRCRCPGCPACAPGGCGRRSTDVDHVVRGAGDGDGNLAAKCRPCHLHKSGREGQAARGR